MSNIRDLGGLITADGRRVRPGMLLRSEAPSTLDAEGRALLGSVPARLVVDLRMTGEGPPATGIWAAGAEPETIVLELLPRVGVPDAAPGDPLGPLLTDLTGATTRAYMFEIYERIVDTTADGALAELVRRITDEGQLPVILHCTAGQDRTGVLAALLLRGVGVERSDVVADYMLTLEHFGRDRISAWAEDLSPAGAELPASAMEPFLVEEAYIEHSLDRAERDGGIEAFFADAGVDAAQLERLRDALLG